jgi:hypothetical protein
MEKPDFWTSYADAMVMSAEGNRLIAQEIVALVRGLLARLGRSGGSRRGPVAVTTRR